MQHHARGAAHEQTHCTSCSQRAATVSHLTKFLAAAPLRAAPCCPAQGTLPQQLQWCRSHTGQPAQGDTGSKTSGRKHTLQCNRTAYKMRSPVPKAWAGLQLKTTPACCTNVGCAVLSVLRSCVALCSGSCVHQTFGCEAGLCNTMPGHHTATCHLYRAQCHHTCTGVC